MSDRSNVWTRGYLPSGRQISITAVLGDDVDGLITLALALDARMAERGLAVREPGLDEGEIKDVYHYVSRRAKVDVDGVETPLIDLYPENFDYAALKVYLNTDADIQAFESASGLQVRDIPLNPNHKNAAARNDAQDARYIRSFPVALVGIKKKNPAYNPEETDLKKKKPQYLFVRWQNANTGDLSNSAQSPNTSTGASGNGANLAGQQTNGGQSTHWTQGEDYNTFSNAVLASYGLIPDFEKWLKLPTAKDAFNAIRGTAEKEQWSMIATQATYRKLPDSNAGTIEFNTDLPTKMHEGRTALAKWMHSDENAFKHWQDGETYDLPVAIVVSWRREGNTRGNSGYRKVTAVNVLPVPIEGDIPF